jgi:glycosyltransferase involved in cell wall biosynthesis
MAKLFISSVVPDTDEYHNAAFTRSGNNVLAGIAEALWSEGNCDMLSFMPTPSYPRGKFWIGSKTVTFESGLTVYYAPILNIKIIKNLFEGIYTHFWLRKWAKRHKTEDNTVLVYNIYDPPIGSLFRACKATTTKLYAILYDLGVPPKRLGLSKATMFAYKLSENSAKKYIPRLDGRIVINESIVKYYSPDKDYILIDGGVNDSVIKSLFPLAVSKEDTYTFVCAGMLWDQNGTKLILDALRINTNSKIRVVFAGKGNDVELIKAAAQDDARISYAGMLSMSDLFKVYQDSDVLLNLRLEEEVDFHFPSKLLEYLATGKSVISTAIAHAKRDYGTFLSILDEPSPENLSKMMDEFTSIPKDELYRRGIKQREFMLTKRNWQARTKEIIDYMDK